MDEFTPRLFGYEVLIRDGGNLRLSSSIDGNVPALPVHPFFQVLYLTKTDRTNSSTK